MAWESVELFNFPSYQIEIMPSRIVEGRFNFLYQKLSFEEMQALDSREAFSFFDHLSNTPSQTKSL